MSSLSLSLISQLETPFSQQETQGRISNSIILASDAIDSSSNAISRAIAFKQACNSTIVQIRNSIIQAITENLIKEPKAFFSAHVSQKGQEELQNLDQRTTTLMLIVLGDALKELTNPPFSIGPTLLLSAKNAGDITLFGKMIKEKACPIVKQAIIKLDEDYPKNQNDPSVVEEHTRREIPPEIRKILTLYRMEYPTS